MSHTVNEAESDKMFVGFISCEICRLANTLDTVYTTDIVAALLDIASFWKDSYSTEGHLKAVLLKAINSIPSFDAIESLKKETKLVHQKFDYFLVIDFEATCDRKRNTLVPQEIIEFPVLKVSGKSFEIESIFHEYVQPKVHKTLTSFCSELTGINQDMIDGQPHLDEVLCKFHTWMEEESLLTTEIHFAFVTYTNWDLNKVLPSQCEHLGISVPSYMRKWIDVQQSFADETGHWPIRGLKDVMRYLKIPPVGRPHCGIDDCRNTVNVMKALARNGHIFSINAPKPKQSVIIR